MMLSLTRELKFITVLSVIRVIQDVAAYQMHMSSLVSNASEIFQYNTARSEIAPILTFLTLESKFMTEFSIALLKTELSIYTGILHAHVRLGT